MSASETLAIDGGPPRRATPLPGRRLMGEEELDAVRRLFEESWASGVDFGYQGPHEERYARSFCELQGGGHADAVSSGSAAVFVALAALDLPRGSEVLYSPVTDPGAFSSAVLQGHSPTLADAGPDGFNADPDSIAAALTPRTRAMVITHLGGIPARIDEIAALARSRGVRLVEDCSQSHGALYRGERVGRFGDIAAFSTMFTKNHSTGGCGGVVYTRDESLYWRARGTADRGKPFHVPGSDFKNPCLSLFPALNFNQSELACVIGASTLAKLPATIARRREIVRRLDERLRDSRVLRPAPVPPLAAPSPFFHTLIVDASRLRVSKEQFARAAAAEGVTLNPDYRNVVAEWPWARPYLAPDAVTPRASAFRERSVNILFNERFTDGDVDDVAACLLKVEAAYAC